jgi:PASTA domain-containing protein
MPSFEVLVNPTSLSGERGREQAIVVTANSSLQNPVTARASVRAQPPTAAAWITPPSNPLGRFPGPNSTCNFAFTLKIPADAAPGSYTLLFDVVDVELPDDHFGTSAPLSLTVATVGPIPNGKGHPPPRWWILVAAAVLVLGVGFVLWKVFFSSKGMPDLREQPYADAIATLNKSQFQIERKDTLHEDTTNFPRGVIISQSIAPKSKLRPDSNPLRLVVQGSYASVPSLVKLEFLEAARRLGAESLRIILGQNEGVNPDGIVMEDTRPPAGTLVLRGQRIGVLIITRVPCKPPICAAEVGQLLFARRRSAAEKVNEDALRAWKPPTP